jgi:hypothetical protein
VSAFFDAEREHFAVELICRTLGVSASAYYQRACGQRSKRALEDERLLGLICDLHTSNYEAYGSRRTWKALKRAGEPVGRGRVERLMRTTASKAPSAAASPGARPRPIAACPAGPISWSETSARPRRTGCGWPT